jgi:anion-transporting  ArsA/GET3 family ATPase
MDPAHFFAASRVLIVAGKGGVGKTTICATLAAAASEAGCSVLIVRLTPGGALPYLFAAPEITSAGTTLRAGTGTKGEISARLVTPDDALLDYLADHGLQRMTRRLSPPGPSMWSPPPPPGSGICLCSVGSNNSKWPALRI